MSVVFCHLILAYFSISCNITLHSGLHYSTELFLTHVRNQQCQLCPLGLCHMTLLLLTHEGWGNEISALMKASTFTLWGPSTYVVELCSQSLKVGWIRWVLLILFITPHDARNGSNALNADSSIFSWHESFEKGLHAGLKFWQGESWSFQKLTFLHWKWP